MSQEDSSQKMPSTSKSSSDNKTFSYSSSSKRKQDIFRRNIKNYSEDQLNQSTKDAQQAEIERQQRLQSLNKLQPELVSSQFAFPAQSASQKLFSKTPIQYDEAIILADEDDLLDLGPSNYVFLEVSDEDSENEPDEIEMEVCELRDAKNLPDEEGRLVINQNRTSNEPVVQIAPHLVNIIKPHQVTGVRFLYENLIESTSAFNSSEGFGCILAHSMGLGKTIQVITFIELLYRYTEAQYTLIIVPINTLQNWIAEFNKWLPLENKTFSTPSTKKPSYKRKLKEENNESKPSEDEKIETEESQKEKVWTNKLRFRKRPFELHAIRDVHKTIVARHQALMAWRDRGGVMLLGYEMFRLLTLPRRIHPSASTPAYLNCLDDDTESVTSSVSSKSARSRKSKKARTDDLMEEDLTNDSVDEQIQMYTDFREVLLDPGPDVIICDEGHRIKNSEASISKALKAVRTKRRVVLTGYPIQNNLMEYWCMVDFVRPNFLGTKQEFTGMFVRPIDNGHCIDSTFDDRKLMQGRAHVLHELLQGFVQRRSHAVLKASLPEKSEVVLLVKLSPLQRMLYRAFMQSLHDSNNFSGSNTLKTYAMCCKIWNHPDILWHVMENYSGDDTEDFDELLGPSYGSTPSSTKSKRSRKSTTESVDTSAAEDSILDCSFDDVSDLPGPAALYRTKAYIAAQKRAAVNNSMNSQSTSDLFLQDSQGNSDQTRFGGSLAAQRHAAKMFHQKMAMMQNPGTYDWATNDTLWPKDYIPGVLAHGGKIVLFMRILEASLAQGDKILAFSQSLFTLDLLERLLQARRCPMLPHERELVDKTEQIITNTCPNQNGNGAAQDENKYTIEWRRNYTYFRLDGSTPGSERERMIDQFNDLNNPARLFLMSTRAGCLGINLVAANRVIVLDASWNPCHDCQAVCRIYRYGQKKTCHIYRLISDNTMEKKIYDRQVTKQGMSDRVVDELNPTQQFTRAQVEVLIDYQDIDQPTLTDADIKQAKELMDQDSVLQTVLTHSRDWVTKCPFTHESLLIDQKDYRLTKVEKRLARQQYETERQSSMRTSKANELHLQHMMNLQRLQHSLSQSNVGELGSVNLDTVRNNLSNQLANRSQSLELDPVPRTLPNGGMVIDPQRFNPIIQKLRQEDSLKRASMLQREMNQARSRQSGTNKRKSRPETRAPLGNSDIVLPEVPLSQNYLPDNEDLMPGKQPAPEPSWQFNETEMQPQQSIKPPPFGQQIYPRLNDHGYQNWQPPARFNENAPFPNPPASVASPMSAMEVKNSRKQTPMMYNQTYPMQMPTQQTLSYPDQFMYTDPGYPEESSYYNPYYQNYSYGANSQGYPTPQTSSHDYSAETN